MLRAIVSRDRDAAIAIAEWSDGALSAMCTSPVRASVTWWGMPLPESSWAITLAERLTCELYERMLQLYACTPQERYETLLQRCPELLNIVALKELASYLRVRPETLSRIRGRVR